MTRLRSILAIIFLATLLVASNARAQQAEDNAAQTQQNQTQPNLSAAQLDALVAPIALYPDPLLSEVLMASTYPVEVVEASRWADANKGRQGDELKAALDKQDWDDSVRALVATPAVLSMMSQQLDWTQKLGDAVLAQQADVMDAIQRLRARAQAADKLQTTPQQTVSVAQDQGKQIIAIEPTSADTLYVPYYDPSVVYGGWPYPDYPPFYFPAPPGYIVTGVVATGIAFGAGYALGRWASGDYLWGGGFRWRDGNIVINRSLNVSIKTATWQHNSYHRRGIAYSNADVANRFARDKATLSFRDRSGHAAALKPHADNRPIGRGGIGGGRPTAITAARYGKFSYGRQARSFNRAAFNRAAFNRAAFNRAAFNRAAFNRGGYVQRRPPSIPQGAHFGGGRPGGGRAFAAGGGFRGGGRGGRRR
jgi:uncharacterized protein DUF3300